MNGKKSHLAWFAAALVFLAAALFLLPGYCRRTREAKAVRADDDSLKVIGLKWKEMGSRLEVTIRTRIHNSSALAWEQLEGDLDFYCGDQWLYGCHCLSDSRLEPGEEAKISFTTAGYGTLDALVAHPTDEIEYSWKPTAVRFVGDKALKIALISLLSLFVLSLLTGIVKVKKAKKRPVQSASLQVPEAEQTYPGSSYSGYAASGGGGSTGGYTGAYGFSSAYTAAPASADALGWTEREEEKTSSPAPAPSLGGRKPASGVNNSLISATLHRASYASQGLTQNAEDAGHRVRTAYADVLAESADLSGRAADEMRSAKHSFDYASRQTASYRSSGESQRANAEEAEHRMRSAHAGMLEAVAKERGDARAFASAKSSYEYASRQAASYRSSGQTENALEAEHRMRTSYAQMQRATTQLDRDADKAYRDAERKLDYASRQATNYRKQGLLDDAERNDRDARSAQAGMLKAMAAGKGNAREIESAYQDYENANRRYMECKRSGRESDAQMYKGYMDRAYAEMMKYV